MLDQHRRRRPHLIAWAVALLMFASVVGIAILRWRGLDSGIPARVEASGAGPPTLSTPHARDALVRALSLMPGEPATMREAALTSFEGRVVSRRDGIAIENAELVFEGPGGARSVRSTDNGEFRLVLDREGSFELTLARADGFEPLPNAITLTARRGASVRGVTVELVADPERRLAEVGEIFVLGIPEGAASIAGTITSDETRAPMPTFTVVLGWLDADGNEHVDTRSFADPSGTYVVRNIAAGTYDVRVAAFGHLLTARRSVTLRDGATERADFALTASCAIRGSVRSDGRPITGARVRLEDGSFLGSGSQVSTFTDASGHFSVVTRELGPSSLEITIAGHHTRVLTRSCGDVGEIALTPLRDGEAPRSELTGIGAVLEMHGRALYIERLVPGGAAELAGLARGDRLHAVADEPVESLGLHGAIERIRGPERSKVRLSISRGEEPPRVLAIERTLVRY